MNVLFVVVNSEAAINLCTYPIYLKYFCENTRTWGFTYIALLNRVTELPITHSELIFQIVIG